MILTRETDYALRVLRWKPMPKSEATNAPSWRQRLFVPTARYTATNRTCGKRFAP